MTLWKQRLSIQALKMPKEYRLSVFACILVVLSLMFGNAHYNTGGMAYAEEEATPTHAPTSIELPFEKCSATSSFPVNGQPWSSSGWFNIVWGDGPEGESETLYTLTDDSGQITPLLLDETLSQSVGGVLWFNRKKVNVAGVWATSLSGRGAETGLNVTSIFLVPSPEPGPLSEDVSPAVTGSQPWVTIMCKFNDVATEPHNLAYFSGMYANVYPRLDHYWRELSYDTFNVAGSNAFGWFTLPHPEAYYNPTDTTGGANLNLLWTDCVNAADATVNFTPYLGINMMFNTDFDNGYAWGGSRTRTIDGVTRTWRVTWEPPWAYADISVIQHEMGHGFGLPHSSGAYGQTYDNAWDVMSKDRYNCAAATDPTYGCIAQGTISYHKDILGVIPAGRKFTAALGSSTTITLEQLAQPVTANYKMVQIPIGGSSTYFYTVEARRLTGYDSKLAGAAVVIHEVDTARQIPAHVIDTDLNGVTSDAGAMWVVGETFTDAANHISVHVDSATATGFQVTIVNAVDYLPAPVLTAEPPTTTGTENIVYWSAVSAQTDIPLVVGSRLVGQSTSKDLSSTSTIAPGDGDLRVDDGAEPAQATLPLESVYVTQVEENEVLLASEPLPAPATIFSETFEGAFPGTSWALYGSPTWNVVNYDKHGGAWSGWCRGSFLNPVNGYTDNMNAWVVCGPFSLADASSAGVSFWYKNLSENGYDYFGWYASVDGVNFYGYRVSGDQNSWRNQVFDLTSVPTIGDLLGQTQVWISFIFTSDSAMSGPTYKGAYVDDVIISKDAASVSYSAECADNSGFSSPRNSGWITQTSTTFNNLTPGQTYWYRVKAKSGTVESGWSNIEHSHQEPSGTIQLSAATYSVNESGGSVLITVTRSGGSSGAVGVSYATSNGTATAGSDYTSTSGTLSWANGDTANKTFTVSITDDSLYEGNETVNLTLTNPTGGATLGSPSTAVLTIVDNDPVPDTTPPSLVITSHSDGQHVSASSITLVGTASDSGKGDNGIQQVTVNGVRASNDTTTGGGTANWSRVVALNPGATTVTVIAYDNSPNHNPTSQAIMIYYDAPVIYVSKDGVCHGNNPCFPNIQNGIAWASTPCIIKITQETYTENIILDFDQVITLQGGWDTNFTLNSSATSIQGSITITNGKMIIENIILK